MASIMGSKPRPPLEMVMAGLDAVNCKAYAALAEVTVPLALPPGPAKQEKIKTKMRYDSPSQD